MDSRPAVGQRQARGLIENVAHGKLIEIRAFKIGQQPARFLLGVVGRGGGPRRLGADDAVVPQFADLAGRQAKHFGQHLFRVLAAVGRAGGGAVTGVQTQGGT